MTSKFGMKTYSRQKVCQSSIQFDQLFNQKCNKPTAAKSKGTLHRWGMTSFTSMRNTQLNGRKEDVVKTEDNVKRRKLSSVVAAATSASPDNEMNDPFSFESEQPESTIKPSKSSSTTSVPSTLSKSRLGSTVPSKTNKFFKSGGSRSLFKSKQLSSSGNTLLTTSCDLTSPTSTNVFLSPSVSVGDGRMNVIQSTPIVNDPFSQLLLSTGISTEFAGQGEIYMPSMKDETDVTPVTTDVFSTLTAMPPPQQRDMRGANNSALINHAYAGQEQIYFQNSQQQSQLPGTTIHFQAQPSQQQQQLEVCFSVPEMEKSANIRTYGAAKKVLLTSVTTDVHDGNSTIHLSTDRHYQHSPALLQVYDAVGLPASGGHSEILQSHPFDTNLLSGSISDHQLSLQAKVLSSIPPPVVINTQVVVPPEPASVMQSQPATASSIVIMPQRQVATINALEATIPTSATADIVTIPQHQIATLVDPLGSTMQPPLPTVVMKQSAVGPSLLLPSATNSDEEHESDFPFEQSVVDNISAAANEKIETVHVDEQEEANDQDEDVDDDEDDDDNGQEESTVNDSVVRSGQMGTLDEKDKDVPDDLPKCRRSSSTGSSKPPSRVYSVLRHRRIFNSPKKVDRKALYKHRPWQADDEPVPEGVSGSSKTSLADEFDNFEDDDTFEKPTLTRVTTWPTKSGEEAITSVKCPKKFRELYAVVKNVKQAHQCHESGETQEFNDDIDYLLEGLQDTFDVGTRCLSILSLAGKCMEPAFRMHLRAHGTFTKVFSALHDAPKDPNLSLCTATVMFILSQDRLNMDLERSSLDLMLQLLDLETGLPAMSNYGDPTNGHSREIDKVKQRVRELCEESQKNGHAKHLDLDNITTGVLAMETLLSLTSRRAGEWFKEELRELGGLDHLVNTVSECANCLPAVFVQLTEFALDKLRKLDRCLRVLENVTFMNTQNQIYLISCQNSSLIYYCARAMKLCESCLKVYPTPDNSDRESPSWILFSCLLSVTKVLLNLTNENQQGSAKVGEQVGLISSALSCVFHVPPHLSVEQRFDLLVMSLGLLINLVEYCDINRQRLFYTEVPNMPSSNHRRCTAGSTSAPKALVHLFGEYEEAARKEEAQTDSLLDGKGEIPEDGTKNKDENQSSTQQSSPDDLEETLKKALQKAGKNMEDSMIAAYIALLLGCLIQDNKENAARIRDHLPNKDFNIMVQILKKFFNFMNLANLGNTGVKYIQRVIDVMESNSL